jgi:hypothetical protein
MNDTTVKVDLVGLLGLDEDGLRLMTLLGRENLVGFSGSDGEWSVDG